jgi:membrane fusion protein (multidrug efflux system)
MSHQQNPPRRALLLSAQLALLLAGLLSLAGCKDKQKPAPPAPLDVGVVTLREQPVPITTELPGRVAPFRVSDVRPQVNGVVQKRLFNEGATVKAGQLLYQIDPAPYEAALNSAKAGLARAEASVASAQALVNRYRPLVDVHAISRQDFDNAVAAHRQAMADVASGRAAVQTAAINLAYTRVTSPIEGRTGRSSITEGALVTANQANALVTITQLDPTYVDVTQPSTTLLRLKRELASGQLQRAGEDQAKVSLLLEDGSPYERTGTLQFSEVQVDPGTGSVTLRAVFPNPDGLLLPGMFVREELAEGIDQNALLLPQRAVTHNQRGDATALVVGADHKLELRVLKTERTIGNDWLVTDGVKAGEQVVVEGLQKARPGAEVTVHEAPREPPKNQQNATDGGTPPQPGQGAQQPGVQEREQQGATGQPGGRTGGGASSVQPAFAAPTSRDAQGGSVRAPGPSGTQSNDPQAGYGGGASSQAPPSADIQNQPREHGPQGDAGAAAKRPGR